MKQKLRKAIEQLPVTIPALKEIPLSFYEFLKDGWIFVDGKPFNLKDRPWLIPICKDPVLIKYILKARQVGGSVLVCAWLIHNLLLNPGTIAIYMTDRFSHVQKFHRDKLKPILENSPRLKALVNNNESNIERLVFVNGSSLYKLSAWLDMDSAKGITANFIVVDEAQDCSLQDIDTLLRTQDAIKLKNPELCKLIITGTGDILDSAWHRLYSQSTMQEFNKDARTWEKRQETSRIQGYRIPQGLLHKQEHIDQLETTMQTDKFLHYVMAEFSQGAKLPITRAVARQCYYEATSMIYPQDVNDASDLYMGIDLAQSSSGGSETVLTVIRVTKGGGIDGQDANNTHKPHIEVLWTKKYAENDTITLANFLITDIHAWDLPLGHVVCDAGGNLGSLQEVEKEFADGYITKAQLNAIAEPVKYDKMQSENKLLVDKSTMVQRLIDAFHDKRVSIPQCQETEWTLNQYTAIESKVSQRSASTSQLRFVCLQGSNDDALMSLGFAIIGSIAKSDRNNPSNGRVRCYAQYEYGGPMIPAEDYSKYDADYDLW